DGLAEKRRSEKVTGSKYSSGTSARKALKVPLSIRSGWEISQVRRLHPRYRDWAQLGQSDCRAMRQVELTAALDRFRNRPSISVRLNPASPLSTRPRPSDRSPPKAAKRVRDGRAKSERV